MATCYHLRQIVSQQSSAGLEVPLSNLRGRPISGPNAFRMKVADSFFHPVPTPSVAWLYQQDIWLRT